MQLWKNVCRDASSTSLVRGIIVEYGLRLQHYLVFLLLAVLLYLHLITYYYLLLL